MIENAVVGSPVAPLVTTVVMACSPKTSPEIMTVLR